jgi:hypothetical protein
MCPAGRTGSIAFMTTTPDDQDWLQLAEDAFSDGQPMNESQQENGQALTQWRYRAAAI